MKQSGLFILLFVSVLRLGAQTAEQCINIAREQIILGNDLAARQMFQRVLFFDRKTYGMECYQQLAELNLRTGNFGQSAFYFDLVFQNAKSDAEKNEALVQKAGALLLQEKYTEARREILSLKDESEEWKMRKLLYLGACFYGEKDFAASEKIFLQIVGDKSPSQRAEVKKHFKKAKKINRKKPKTAKVLSMVLPGAGQLYAGDYRNALNSFGLNALMAYWFIYTAQTFTFSDAILSTGSWVFRYYAGGYQRAPLLTEEVKDKKLKDNFQSLLRTVQAK